MNAKTGSSLRKPNPEQRSAREELEQRLTSVPGLTRQPGRRGHGSAYFISNREIVHFHGEERVDVRLTRQVIHTPAAERLYDARVRTRGPSSDWVAVQVVEFEDVTLAMSLVKVAMGARANLAK
ncbi:MAG: luciferase family protein [Thermoplasmata archaeon]